MCRIVFLRKSSDALDLLTEAKLERRFRPPGGNLSNLYAAYYVAELLNELTDDYDPHPELFDAADANVGRAAHCDVRSRRALLRFELTALRVLGHLPSLETCAECGKPVEARRPSAVQPAGRRSVVPIMSRGQKQIICVSAGVLAALRAIARPPDEARQRVELDARHVRRAAGGLESLLDAFAGPPAASCTATWGTASRLEQRNGLRSRNGMAADTAHHRDPGVLLAGTPSAGCRTAAPKSQAYHAAAADPGAGRLVGRQPASQDATWPAAATTSRATSGFFDQDGRKLPSDLVHGRLGRRRRPGIHREDLAQEHGRQDQGRDGRRARTRRSPARRSRKGDALFRQKEFMKAADKYKIAYKRWPDSPLEEEAIFKAAESQFFADRYSKADDDYALLIKKFPSTQYLSQVVMRRFAIGRYWEQYDERTTTGPLTPNLVDKTRPMLRHRRHTP